MPNEATLRVERWEGGIVEEWKSGKVRVEEWKGGKVEK